MAPSLSTFATAAASVASSVSVLVAAAVGSALATLSASFMVASVAATIVSKVCSRGLSSFSFALAFLGKLSLLSVLVLLAPAHRPFFAIGVFEDRVEAGVFFVLVY